VQNVARPGQQGRAHEPVLILLDNAKLLKSMDGVTSNRAGSSAEVGSGRVVTLGATIDALQTADSDTATEVDLTGDGGSTDKEPILIIGSKLLEGSSLDEVNPLGELDLAALLQVRGVGGNKLGGGDIAHTGSLGLSSRHILSIKEFLVNM
jgi:hypothetical protein